MFTKQTERMRWWMVYVFVGVILGVLLEILAATVPFWSYDPWWLVFFVVLFAFGLSPATLALLLRKQSLLVVFLVGSVLAFLVEGLSVVIPTYGWEFASGLPMGIENVFWRTVALGFGGGLFILIAHAITYQIFVLATKPNKEEE